MINFNNTYTSLPSDFYQQVKAEDFPNAKLIVFNQELAKSLGLTNTDDEVLITKTFSGQDKSIESIALVYAGHQFGHFNPRLGDGRALLLGEIDSPDGQHFDIQLKGSGRTMYSRGGDGRSAIGPVIREYLVSEAMFHLNVPTTRSLCAIATNDEVYRETPLPGGILTRVAASHIRIGTFEYFASRGEVDSLKKLADYTINRHYRAAKNSDNPYISLLEMCARNWAHTISRWMSLGFIHGVMNTDNMAISGETIDYGPCAFMDHFKFSQVYSFIDRNGRYSYGNQINIGKWNLSRFASALLPLINNVEVVQNKLNELYQLYDNAWIEQLSLKLGLDAPNSSLVVEFLELLEKHNLDFTNSFYELSHNDSALDHISEMKMFKQKWPSHDLELMKKHNPAVIPRNHQIEKAIKHAEDADYDYFFRLLAAIKTPFSCQDHELMRPPATDEVVKNTFCGT